MGGRRLRRINVAQIKVNSRLFVTSLNVHKRPNRKHCDISGILLGLPEGSVVIIPSSLSPEAIETELSIIADQDIAAPSVAREICERTKKALAAELPYCDRCSYHTYSGGLDTEDLTLECAHPDDFITWNQRCRGYDPAFGSDHWQFENHEGQEPDHG